ncbi:MAG: hypothetical protein ACK4QP_12435 [Pseudorhizobium sp.]
MTGIFHYPIVPALAKAAGVDECRHALKRRRAVPRLQVHRVALLAVSSPLTWRPWRGRGMLFVRGRTKATALYGQRRSPILFNRPSLMLKEGGQHGFSR